MINISKSGNAIKFVFTDSDHYLYGNGEIEVPVNSLSLIVDESNMVTFRKANSNDIFLSFNPANSNLSDKAGVIDFYKSNMVGSTGGGSESGITSGEVQTMIDESVSGKADTATVLSVSGDVQTNASNIADIWDTIDEKEEVIASALTEVRQDVADIDAKEEVIASALTEVRQDVDKKPDIVYIDFMGLYNGETEITDELYNSWLEAKENGAVFYTSDTMAVDGLRSEPLVVLSGPEGEFIRFYLYNDYGWQNATAMKVGENEYEVSPDEWFYEVDDQLNSGSTSPVQNAVITQALENKLDASAYTPTDLSNYYTKSEVYNKQEVDTALGAKQATLVSGTNIKTINNESILGSGNIDIQGGSSITVDDALSTTSENPVQNKVITNAINAKQDALSAGTGIEISGNVISATGGGGATYSAGTNISIDTANTINCTLNLTNGTGNNSIKSKGNATAAGPVSFSFGQDTEAPKAFEVAFGWFNKPAARDYMWGDNGNTLFTLGNGANSSYKHNAFEIRQNGDIYFPDTDNTSYAQYYRKPMVRLQDMYGALGGLKFVKLTQAQYSAMEQAGTLDANTLYIVTNVVS